MPIPDLRDQLVVDGVPLPISGVVDSAFERIYEAFVDNFVGHGEVGARVTVLRQDEVMVDLCGGHVTGARDQAWNVETLVCCNSVTKGVVALAAHLLVQRGLLDLDAPVARYWPEFAQNGKAAITVRQAMSHQASLAIIDYAQPGEMLDWGTFTSKIAAQAPNWVPATDECYHATTYGFIVGEIVRRVDDRTIDRFIADEIAGPLGADYVIGCGDTDLARIAPQVFNPASEMMGGGLLNERTMLVFNGLPADPAFFGSSAFFRWVFPSGGGVSNALGLARLFAPLANNGRARGVDFMTPRTLAEAAAEQWHHDDSLAGIEYRVAVGLNLHCAGSYFGREGNVGSIGGGGYVVFADPVNRITFAYTPNRFTSGKGLGGEPRRLIDALYASL